MLSTGISYTVVSSPSHSASQPTIINTQVPTVVAMLSTGISYTAPSLQYSANQPTIINTEVPTGSTASILSVSLAITGGI